MVYLPQVFQFTPLREGRPAGIFDATRRPYFNSRPSARGDDGLHTLFERLPDFNSRPSARGDIAALVAFRHVEDFNSRPSARGDREFVHGAARVGISIHAPPRGATSQKNAKKGFTRFQFTPLREGRRAPVWYHIIRSNISIHAPPRGATCAILVSSAGSISIHAPPRGATRACWLAADGADISIHAPPRGATKPDPPQSGGSPISIHAPPRGATTAKPQGLGAFQFQFTPLREGRRVSFASRKPVSPNFNSRPSARGDPIPAHGDSTFPFQFTPLREGRRVTRSPTPQAANFNSRPSARGDLMPFRHFPCLSISIHAPPRGATAHRPAAQAELHYFNSRPSARGDLKCLITGCAHLAISIHAPPRGATCVPRRADGACAFQFTPLREGRRAFPPLVRR